MKEERPRALAQIDREDAPGVKRQSKKELRVPEEELDRY